MFADDEQVLIQILVKRYMNFIFLNRKLTIDEQLPVEYLKPFKCLWVDQSVQSVIKRGNEFALHDNLS